MKLLHKILNRLNILTVTYQDKQHYSISIAECRYRNEINAGELSAVSTLQEAVEKIAKVPVILVITGYGVICKDSDISSEIVKKVKSGSKEFLYTENDGKIAFVRHDQIAALLSELNVFKTKLIDTECSAEFSEPEVQIKKIAEAFFNRDLRLRKIIKPTDTGSMLAGLLFEKTRLYVLGFMLIIVAINAVVNPGLRREYEAIRTEHISLEEKKQSGNNASKVNEKMMAEFNRTFVKPISILCDRAAVHLPSDIQLSNMAVRPLSRNIEKDKQPQFVEDIMIVSGQTPKSDNISTYVSSLENSGMVSNVKLSKVEYNKETRLYDFTVNLELK